MPTSGCMHGKPICNSCLKLLISGPIASGATTCSFSAIVQPNPKWRPNPHIIIMDDIHTPRPKKKEKIGLKPSQLIQVMTLCAVNKFTLMVIGPPGGGKTDITTQVAESIHADLIVLHPVIDDPTDYKGFPFKLVDADGKASADFLTYGKLQQMIDAKKLTMVLLDDMGQAPKTVQAAAMQLVWGGQLNGTPLSPHVTFVMASNRREDKAAVSSIIEPLKNRSTIVHLGTDVDDWCLWGIKNGQPPENIAFNRFRNKYLTDGYKATADFTNSATPRSIARCGDFLKAGVPKTLEFDIYEGTAGKAFAAEFTGFLKIFREIPDINEIIKKPKKVAIPTKDDILYATCEALASKANKSNFDNIVIFGSRLPEEYMMMLVRDSIAHNKNVTKTNGFIQWQAANQDILLFTGNE